MIIPIFITKLHIAIVAGDQLNVTFNGNYEITCQDPYPNRSEVDGKIKDFALKKLIYSIYINHSAIRCNPYGFAL